MEDLVTMVRDVNPHRSPDNLTRRLLKILEELGETAEAYLSVSSPHNYKNKTWFDYREEACDTLIVLIDVGLTQITSSFPPATMLPSSINVATSHSFESLDRLTHEKFAVAGAVSDAANHLAKVKDDGLTASMGFYGAINRGIQAAANMCFALIPEDQDRDVIAQRVHEMFVAKLDKWSRNMAVYQATDDGK